jgi:transposase-like protein
MTSCCHRSQTRTVREICSAKQSGASQRSPETITLDGYAASHRSVRELKGDGCFPTRIKLRSSKYLNNVIEQDHRGVRQRVAVMLGINQFRNAAITIAGIELMQRIRMEQFNLRRPGITAL